MNNRPALLGNAPVFDQKINIVRPVLPHFDEIAAEAREIVETGSLTKGRHLRAFEEAVAAHLGVRHAVAVSSCTSGLMLTYQALGLAGEAVVPSFTFMATVSALAWAGVRPAFADVKRSTINLDPSAVESAITPATTAIVAVHTFGNPAEIEELQSVADRHGLPLVFDAAHGFGSLHEGRPVGAQGDAQVFSLTPTKLLIAGEGGIVATDRDDVAERVRIGREYGNAGDYDSAFAGLNARLPELNALLGLRSLSLLEEAALRRNAAADIYRARLGRLPGVAFQTIRPGDRSSYKDFPLVIDPDAFGLTRGELALALAAENVETRNYYDPPVHRHTAYRHFSPAADLPDTDFLSSNVICLPVWSDMDDSLANGVCAAVERAHNFSREIKAKLRETDASAGRAAARSER